VAETWAMANMNMIIHDMEGQIEIGDTFKNPKFRERGQAEAPSTASWPIPCGTRTGSPRPTTTTTNSTASPPARASPANPSADWGWVQHIHASLKPSGRAAVVLDTGAASRGSGNDGTSKERTVRQWFVDHDLVESVLYLPENLFYNTTAPGIVLFLNKAKPKEPQGKVFLVNASQRVRKGRPQELHSRRQASQRIADTLIALEGRGKTTAASSIPPKLIEERLQHLPQPLHPHRSDAETYRPIAEIVEELKVIEAEARETDEALRKILQQLGVAK
jgi:type I restriction enzyme M protein